MFKQYFKQAWQLMKQNRFYSAVYITGTGVAIALVMMIAIVYHIKTGNMAPEVNRDRLLFNEHGISKGKEKGMSSAFLSYQTLKECFYNLQTPECVTALSSHDMVKDILGDIFVGYQGSPDQYEAIISCTDANFWKVFRFSFIEGMPYNEEEFQSGVSRAVLSESLVRKIFGTTDAIGKAITINDMEYRVGGVVKDVSPTMSIAYAELWIPFTSQEDLLSSFDDNTLGTFKAYILAKKQSDFDAIRSELNQHIEKYNTTLPTKIFSVAEGMPYSQQEAVIRKMDYSSTYKELIMRYGLVALVFLLVPAVNLSGLTTSKMQERITEIGIRKAFGATPMSLIHQVLTENFFLTLIGGMIGLLISCLVVWGFGNNLLFDRYTQGNIDAALSPAMLFNLTVFIYAFGVCIFLNIISSLIPVWNTSRKQIIETLYDK